MATLESTMQLKEPSNDIMSDSRFKIKDFFFFFHKPVAIPNGEGVF